MADGSERQYGASAREAEADDRRAWSVLAVCWCAGLAVIALGIVVITAVVVYTNCCRAAVSGDDMAMRLGVTRYGSALGTVRQTHH